MNDIELYPLRFEPIYQYRIWGGRRLSHVLSAPLPGDKPIGEAWVLSDRDDHTSRIADGPLKGKTIRELIDEAPKQMLGALANRVDRYPLLMKFLDAREMLSVQVHPPDSKKDLLPPGEQGKTEAWVVLESDPASKIYAGLTAASTPNQLRESLANETIESHLAHFTPQVGDAVFLQAGTVHALGGGVLVFEVQQNSDVTFRLYDWDRIDPSTGKRRDLQIDQALSCIDYEQKPVVAVTPVVLSTSPVKREMLFKSQHFWVWRTTGGSPFFVGAQGFPRVLVCLEGMASIDYNNATYRCSKGDTIMLPAAVGKCACVPNGPINLLEISVP